ncbi:hypothetical protein AGMMS49960_15390 [Betaproteobacteria bacterium]|nr:hypothetical protein AGMMS49543_14420 [Betaproteobacteria bacterium]GHU02656.1 hypothetical protein AGMMS49960_15390 [Betaproteobacteria bacterium]GHU20817.1 hypothetical protein AGMMS50243_16760 [Betaproteobacteria bacterium]
MFTKPKLLSCLAFALTVLCTPLVQAANYSGVWWNPTLSGMGLNFLHEGDTVAVTWYHYDDNSNSTFLNLSGNLNGNTLSGKLYRSRGTPPGPLYDASARTTIEVGSATLTFNSDKQATFTYNFEGKQGSFSVERFVIGGTGATGEEAYNVNLNVEHTGQCGSDTGRKFVQGTLRLTMHADGGFTVVSPSGYTYEQHPGAVSPHDGDISNSLGTVTGHGRTGDSKAELDRAGKDKDFDEFEAVTNFGSCFLKEETTSMTKQ